MEELRALADGEEVDEDDGMLMDLPKPLVEAVLALPPIQRASLGALIAGSLAEELEHARSMVTELATYASRSQKPVRHGGRAERARP